MTKKKKTWTLATLSLCVLAFHAHAEVPVPEPLRTAFYPYSTGSLSQAGITPGTIIDTDNWQLAEPVLPPEILQPLQAGDFTITVQETTDLPVRDAYIAATVAHFQAASLDSGYTLNDYQGGRPFPVLDPTDSHAGEKAAWNFRYRDMPETMEMRGIMQGVNNAGTIDRSNTGHMRVRYGMYRMGDEEDIPQWREQGVRLRASFEALNRQMEGFFQITTFYDNGAQPYDSLSYSPQNRRTRKNPVNMLMRMGGGRYDVLQEEQPPFFFNGYLHEYEWTYTGEQVMLVPGFLQADHVTYGGKNNWYPEVPWELRRVVVLEVTPKGTHPYSKRTFYHDAQTYALLGTLSYDPQGAFERLSLIVHGNPDFVPGSQGTRLPVPLGATWINLVQNRAARMVIENPKFDCGFAPQRFELVELLRRGK